MFEVKSIRLQIVTGQRAISLPPVRSQVYRWAYNLSAALAKSKDQPIFSWGPAFRQIGTIGSSEVRVRVRVPLSLRRISSPRDEVAKLPELLRDQRDCRDSSARRGPRCTTAVRQARRAAV